MLASIVPLIPHLLLLEDDPTSAAALRAGLESLPARVDHAASVTEAADLAAGGGHALWLFDLQLPDGRGDALLARLRAAGLATPALALSADPDAAVDGFLRVLAKPLALADLRTAVAAVLPAGLLPPWDDAAGLAAVAGQAAALHTLRQLFLDELPEQRRQVLAACRAGDQAAARAQLHRLKAGCGFVGALPLLAAVGALHAAPDDAVALQRFDACSARLLAGA
ncbi:transcriptional regulator [Arenimonas soli]|uniref:Transcriptional regulator n=1 Tax=Arenimonas soli TaxID=2269504 RepID=A0ABQ1HDN2_9GAMM|nr:response regulator [Arenimonas soli]GGA72689.1 transcriptional regulator [Arenimonas soli]